MYKYIYIYIYTCTRAGVLEPAADVSSRFILNVLVISFHVSQIQPVLQLQSSGDTEAAYKKPGMVTPTPSPPTSLGHSCRPEPDEWSSMLESQELRICIFGLIRAALHCS